jgi:ribonuclease Y
MEIAIAAVVALVLAIASGVISFRLGISYRKKIAEAEIGGAETEAKRIWMKP